MVSRSKEQGPDGVPLDARFLILSARLQGIAVFCSSSASVFVFRDGRILSRVRKL